jgi:hypothetical protein
VCACWPARSAIVHASTHSDAQSRDAGQSRALWLVLVLVGRFVQPLGVVLAILYVVAIRPKLDRAPVLLP